MLSEDLLKRAILFCTLAITPVIAEPIIGGPCVNGSGFFPNAGSLQQFEDLSTEGCRSYEGGIKGVTIRDLSVSVSGITHDSAKDNVEFDTFDFSGSRLIVRGPWTVAEGETLELDSLSI
jgi:hypothetical protein